MSAWLTVPPIKTKQESTSNITTRERGRVVFMTPSGYRRLTLDEQVATGNFFIFSFCFIVILLLYLFVPSVYTSAVLLSSSLFSIFFFLSLFYFIFLLFPFSLFSFYLVADLCMFVSSLTLPFFLSFLAC